VQFVVHCMGWEKKSLTRDHFGGGSVSNSLPIPNILCNILFCFFLNRMRSYSIDDDFIKNSMILAIGEFSSEFEISSKRYRFDLKLLF